MAKNPTVNYWIDASKQTEADMRQEMINTLEGEYPEISKGQVVLLRKFRRDSTGAMVKCACVDVLTGEPDKDSYCPISFAEKFMWDESRILAYREALETPRNLDSKSPGLLNIPLSVFYMRYDIPIVEDDKLVEIALELDGRPSQPLRRTAVYRINQLIGFRADRGRLEYWKAICSREFVKFLNPPT